MKMPSFKLRIIYWLAIVSLWSVGAILPAQTIDTESTAYSDSAFQTGNIVFAVIGDFGEAGQPEADVANLVKAWNPSFIITVGDNNYPNGAVSSIDENIGQYYHQYIFKYNGKYGDGSAVNQFFPALGNHDWDQNNGRQQELYFTLPGNERYYDFIQGSAHFFVLNSNVTEPEGADVNSKQAKWLKKALAASTSKFDIVILHHPPYSSGRHGSTTRMQWPYKSWGADAVLSGHDHLYERILVDGLPYFVNGIGGAESLYRFENVIPESKFRYNLDYGAMRVEANNQTMKFQLFSRAGVLVDEYTIGNVPPVVTSILRASPNPTNSSSVDFTVTFSDAVSGVDVSDFSLATTSPTDASILGISGSGIQYTVSVNSGSSDNTLRLDLIDNDSILNSTGVQLGATGNGNGNFINGEIYNIDKTPPRVSSITRVGVSPTNASSLDFSITFSEAVSGVDASDFNLISTKNSGASISGIKGAGTTYIATVFTGTGEDTLRLDFIDDDTTTDFVGNKIGGVGTGNGNFAGNETYSVDRISPKVTSIVRANSSPTNASNVDFIVTFSEPITGLDTFALNLFSTNKNGASKSSISSVNGVGNVYSVTVNTDLNDDTIRLDLIDNDSITDLIGNALGGSGEGNGNFYDGEIYIMDKSVPYVTSIIRASSNPSNLASVNFIVTLSESVTGVDLSDFILYTTNISGASITSVNSFDPFYIVAVNTGSGDGALRLDLIDDDSITNGSNLGGVGLGNGTFNNGEIYTIDKTAPIVTSIIRASANPANSTSVDFIVTFSESVTGVDVGDFKLNTENINRASVISLNSLDPFFVVTVNTGIGTGNLRLDQIDDDSIADSANNKLGGLGADNGTFNTGEAFNVSKSSINFPPPSNQEPRKNLLTNNSNTSFAWSRVRGGLAYEIIIAADMNFNNLILSRTVDGTSYTGTSLLTDGTYYWHVRAYNENFQPGKFSATYSFTIDTIAPATPIPTSPLNKASTTRRPTLKWSPVNEAINYQIEVDNNSDFSSPEFRSTKRAASIRTSNLPKGVCFWRVRTKDAAGNWSNWSESQLINIQ
ncbi:MAG: metallophosphoesterase [Chloroflexi bacterium]|nr:metallophosphoesterase [Chloroflexota bacterium]